MLYTDALREARVKANLTQKQVADALHTSRVTIAQYEAGTISAPKLSRLIEMADLYNTTIDKLVGRE